MYVYIFKEKRNGTLHSLHQILNWKTPVDIYTWSVYLFAIWYTYFRLSGTDPCIDQGGTWAVQVHISYLCLVTWAEHTALVTPHTPIIWCPPSKLMGAIIPASCLIVFEKSPTRVRVCIRTSVSKWGQYWPIRNIVVNSQNSARWSHMLSGISSAASLSHYYRPDTLPSGWQSLKIWSLIH